MLYAKAYNTPPISRTPTSTNPSLSTSTPARTQSVPLSQADHSGELRLITCTSRKLKPAERNYPTHEREMLALVHALKKWKHYLMGSKTLAYTDNLALKYWRTSENLSPRQVRWVAHINILDI